MTEVPYRDWTPERRARHFVDKMIEANAMSATSDEYVAAVDRLAGYMGVRADD